ncbi:DMT family transporter [Stappia sp.]|jgi:drug/metabolite transporter (DMT)-like permease|uniref:DMT family transporter n=1 Tax=Stappia sp. TaxID=1870903 RepID=UPI003A9A34D0
MIDLKDPRHRAYALLIVMPVFFSSNLVIGRAAISTVEPWTLAFLRWILAFAMLLPFALAGMRAHRKTLQREWTTLGIMGILGMWICGAGVYFALNYTTASNATLIYTSSPVLILLLEWLFRGRRIGTREGLGILLAIAGVVLIVVKGSLATLLALELNAGDVLMALAAMAWAGYSVLLKRPAFAEVPTLSLFATLAAAGALTLLPFTVVEIAETGRFPVHADAWISILGLALGASVLAFSTFQYGVKVVGPSTTGLFMYLLPPYGVLMSVVFLGEELHLYHFAGFAFIMAGLILATAPRRLIDRMRALLPEIPARDKRAQQAGAD